MRVKIPSICSSTILSEQLDCFRLAHPIMHETFYVTWS